MPNSLPFLLISVMCNLVLINPYSLSLLVDGFTAILVYVDDIILAGDDLEEI